MNYRSLPLCLLLLLIWSSAISQSVFKQKGTASFYDDRFEGKETASGDKYRASKLTAAHLMLPFGTIVKVTNIKNGNFVEVEINDRGPFVEGRLIDLSKSAAEALAFVHEGLAEVEIEVVEHSDHMEKGKSSHKRANRDVPEHKKEFYEVHAEALSPAGFGVQIATFRELTNMMETIHNLKKSYQKKVIVEVVDVNQVPVYKVIIGHIKNAKKAQELQETLKNQYSDCFVYEF
ncbi:MAG: septal ring lytic transglycosylase RlpA family protein [Cytophagales bacterium]